MTSFLKWGFNGTVTNIHGDKTVNLHSAKGEDTSFADLIESKVPIFLDKTKFRLKPYLFNGAFQNLYLAQINQQLMYKVWYGREILTYKNSEKYPYLPDGDTTLDYVVKLDSSKEEFEENYGKTLPLDYPKLHPRTRFMTKEESQNLHESWKANKKPIIVIIHGLLGGSHEYHIRGSAEKLSEQGFNVVVLNGRGCCRAKLTTPHIFTALATDDIRFFIDKLLEEYPDNKLHLLGFSYGAAMLSNYLGEEGANTKITSAMVLGCPWDLLESGYSIHEGIISSRLMAPMLTKYLLNFIKIHKLALCQNKELQIEERLAKAKNDKISKIYEFDQLFTAPLHGFQTATDYYRRASPLNQILNIQTPTLILNSIDDPVISHKLPILEVNLNPFLCLAQTDIGGHFAYVKWDNSLWFLDGVVEYFKAFEDVVEIKSDYKRMTSDYYYKIGQ